MADQKYIDLANSTKREDIARLLNARLLAGVDEAAGWAQEAQRAYDRVHLSEYFSGRDAESLALCDADYYHTHGIQLRSGEAVTAIDREQQLVVTEQGHYAYDQLVLATGSFPFVPPIPGNDSEGCSARTLTTASTVKAERKTSSNSSSMLSTRWKTVWQWHDRANSARSMCW